MPNWCKGILKVRGKKEDILKFLQEGLEVVGDYAGIDEKAKHKVEIDKYGGFIISCDKEEEDGYYYITGTHRNFIECLNFETMGFKKDDIYTIIVEKFSSRGRIYAKDLAEISRKYHIDFRIYAFEGAEFNQEIEIVDGKITIDKEIKFKDYYWECPCPEIGG